MIADIAEIASQAQLNAAEVRQAAARSQKLANMVKTYQSMGLQFEVVEVPAQPKEDE